MGTKRNYQVSQKDHSSAQKLTILWAMMQNVMRENF